MIVGFFCRLSGVVFCHSSRGWSAFLTTSDQSTANLQPRYDPEAPRGIHKRYCNLSRTVWEIAGKTNETLAEIFFGFMRNLNSSPRGQRGECLEFQEYVARSYELRNKIAARVGVRQLTHFGFVGRRTRSAGQIIWRSSGSR